MSIRSPADRRRPLALWLLCAASLMIILDGTIVTGALLVTAGLMLGVYALVGTSGSGWGSVRTLGEAAAALVLLAAFVARQATARAPLLPLRIFSARALAGANLAQLLVIAAAFGFQVMITLYLQRVLGYGAAASGLGLLPAAAVIGTTAAATQHTGGAAGYHLAFAVGAGLSGAAIVVAAAVLWPSRRRSALAECC